MAYVARIPGFTFTNTRGTYVARSAGIFRNSRAGIAAALVITPSAGSLNFTGQAPTIGLSSAGSIQPAPGSLTLAGFAPSVTASAVGITGYQIRRGSVFLNVRGRYQARVGTTFLNITAGPPPLITTVIAIGAGTMSLTGYAPAVASTGSVVVSGGKKRTSLMLIQRQ